MQYTVEQISHYSNILAEQSRKFKNIAMLSGKSVIDSDTYMLGNDLEMIRQCLVGMWIELSKSQTFESQSYRAADEPNQSEKG